MLFLISFRSDFNALIPIRDLRESNVLTSATNNCLRSAVEALPGIYPNVKK